MSHYHKIKFKCVKKDCDYMGDVLVRCGEDLNKFKCLKCKASPIWSLQEDHKHYDPVGRIISPLQRL